MNVIDPPKWKRAQSGPAVTQVARECGNKLFNECGVLHCGYSFLIVAQDGMKACGAKFLEPCRFIDGPVCDVNCCVIDPGLWFKDVETILPYLQSSQSAVHVNVTLVPATPAAAKTTG